MLLIDPTPFKETFQAAPKAAIMYRGTEHVTRGEFILKNGALQGECFPSARGGLTLQPCTPFGSGKVLITFSYTAVAGMTNGQAGTFVSFISFREGEEKLRQDESAKS